MAEARQGTQEQIFRHDRLLGTLVEIRVGTGTGTSVTGVAESVAEAVDRTVVQEMVRLEAVFTAFDDSSELSRWRRGELSAPGRELNEVLIAAHHWMLASDGGFNPQVGILTALWNRAAELGTPPPPKDLAEAALAISTPAYDIVSGIATPRADCSLLNLNAVAKGFIVDRALEAGMQLGPRSLCVNAGGDLAHRGIGDMRVGIENPLRPYDNEPPICVVRLENQAIATSGDARRGFRVGGSWFGHVIDPRTGMPVRRIASVSVIAPTAFEADALTTIAGVMTPDSGVAFVDRTDGVEGLIIDSDGLHYPSDGWGAHVINSR